jgi:RNA polymerase sigma factor (sigma-70 family)
VKSAGGGNIYLCRNALPTGDSNARQEIPGKTPKWQVSRAVKGEVAGIMSTDPSRPFAEIVQRFGQVVAKAVAYTLHSQARGHWYISPTFDTRVDRDEIAELTHEVLMLLPHAIERFRGEAKAETYVSTIARNHVMRVLKRRAREARRRLHMPSYLQEEETTVEGWLDHLQAAYDDTPSFEEQIAEVEFEREAVACFSSMVKKAGLTPEQAEVLRLRRSGWSDAEIARHMGCSQGTVRKRYFDAKNKLRHVYMADPRWRE